MLDQSFPTGSDCNGGGRRSGGRSWRRGAEGTAQRVVETLVADFRPPEDLPLELPAGTHPLPRMVGWCMRRATSPGQKAHEALTEELRKFRSFFENL